MQTFESKIINIKKIAENTISIETEKPTDFNFSAGHFLQFLIPTPENEVLRSYSIASSPQEHTLLFCIKLVKDGVASEYLRNLKNGDILKMKGTFGRFTEEENNNSLFFVATGTGLAPTISIIKDQLKNKGNKNKIHLLLGFRSENNIFWQEELENLEKEYSNFAGNVARVNRKSGFWGIIFLLIGSYFFIGGLNLALNPDDWKATGVLYLFTSLSVFVKWIHFITAALALTGAFLLFIFFFFHLISPIIQFLYLLFVGAV